MTSVFEQRLAEILQVPVYARTTMGEAKAGALAKSMGMGDPAPGKTTDDLALTRFPAGIPADMEDGVRAALSKYHDFDIPDDYPIVGKCFRVATADKNKPLVPREPKKGEEPKPFIGFSDVEIDDAWSRHDIIVAAWSLAAAPARTSASGMYNQTGRNMDHDAFEDFSQTCMIELLRLIENEEDRGDPYLPFIKLKFKHAVSGGVGATSEDTASMGLLRSMIEVGTPAALDKALNNKEYGMSPEVISNPDLKPRQGNRFGKHARTIIQFIEPLRDILKRHTNKATSADAAEDLDEIRNAMGIAADKINMGAVRIFGAKSGQYDTITTTHSDSPIVRWLQKVVNTTNEEELAKVGGPPNNNDEALAIYNKYKEAILSGDEHEIIKARDEIGEWLIKAGDEGRWRKRHRREGATLPKNEVGEETPHPGLVSKDTLEDLDDIVTTKEAARQFLLAGLALDPKTKLPKGVEWTDSAGGKQYASFIDVEELKKGNTQRAYRDYRLLIRHFGLKDYPLKNTGRDPEINWELFDTLTDQFNATVGNGAEKAVFVKVINKKEAIWLADKTAREMHPDDYYEQLDAKADTLNFYKDTGEMPVVCGSEEEAIELARHFASSDWARNGYPAMTAGEIDPELWPGAKAGKAGSKMGELFARAKAVGEIEDPKDREGNNWVKGFVQPGEVKPDSKVGKMAKTLKPTLKLNFDERPWADPKKADDKVGDPATTPKGGTDGVEPPKPTKTEAREIRAAMFETFSKAHRVCQYFLKHAYLTESLDAFDRGLLHKVQNSLVRGMAGTIAPHIGR